jgi:hypothetical protein
MKQGACWRPTNIRSHGKKFSSHGDLAPGVSVFLLLNIPKRDEYIQTEVVWYLCKNKRSGGVRPIHTYHAVPMPFPCHRPPKALDCVFSNWFTQCGRVWVTDTMPFPCHARICLSESDLSRPWQGRGTAWERHGMCELASAVQRRHVGDLPAFG